MEFVQIVDELLAKIKKADVPIADLPPGVIGPLATNIFINSFGGANKFRTVTSRWLQPNPPYLREWLLLQARKPALGEIGPELK